MSTNENTATEKRDVYSTVTSQIINAIEQGVGKRAIFTAASKAEQAADFLIQHVGVSARAAEVAA
jgi:antirestriction protein ArdC